MANKRVKDLPNANTLADADELIIDSSSAGTRRISYSELKSEVAGDYVAAPSTYKVAPLNSSNKIDATYLPTTGDTAKGGWNASTNTPTLANGTGASGDYYDVTTAGLSLGISFTVGDVVKYDGANWFKIDSVANIFDGISTVDQVKTLAQVPNVGTAANEVSVNGMLGDLAFQSSEGPSVGALEAESTTIKSDSGVTTTQALAVTNGTATRLAVLEDGRVGVGTESVTTGFNLEVVSGDMRVADAAGADACELGYSAGAGKSFIQSYNRNTSAFSDLVLNNVATVTASGRLIIANIPTSASGLASGTVWSDSGTLKIVS